MKTAALLVLQFLIFIATAQSQEKKKYYCAPCGCKNDEKIFEEAGKCPLCHMRLLELGTFNFQIASVSKNGYLIYFIK